MKDQRDRPGRVFGTALEERQRVEHAKRVHVLGFEQRGVADVVAADRNRHAAVDQRAQAGDVCRSNQREQRCRRSRGQGQCRDDDRTSLRGQPCVFTSQRRGRRGNRINPRQVGCNLPDARFVECSVGDLSHPLFNRFVGITERRMRPFFGAMSSPHQSECRIFDFERE